MSSGRAESIAMNDSRQLGTEKRTRSKWSKFMSFIVPPKGHRTIPTLSGYGLIFICLGVGVSAYNTGSNILFITVSFLLSSIVLSGVLATLNFSRISWRIVSQAPYRVGRKVFVGLEISNTKPFITSYSLWFDMFASLSNINGRVSLTNRLNPDRTIKLNWNYVPKKRGLETISIKYVGSQFPFGFLKKLLPGNSAVKIFVWPERIDYNFSNCGGARINFQGSALKRKGAGKDIIGTRGYVKGDPRKQINWKASARRGELMVKELAEDRQEGYTLSLCHTKDSWENDEQFEVMCSFAASLAEDLYKKNQLNGAILNGGEFVPIRSLLDLEKFLDELSIHEPTAKSIDSREERKDVISFKPLHTKGVNALVGQQQAGQA